MIDSKFNVAIVANSLVAGGAERFVSLLSKMLESDDLEVHIITVNDGVDFDFHGKRYNLESVSKSKISILKKIQKGYFLNCYLNENNIQLIIDNRPRNQFLREYFTKLIYGKRKKWFVVHSYNLKNYFPKFKFLAQILYSKANRIICVSKAIENLVQEKYGFSNTTTMYNPVDISSFHKTDFEVKEKYILYFGRFNEKVKNFTLMLESFLESEIYQKGYSLYLLGEGPDLNFIQTKIKDLKLEEFVRIIPFTKDPSDYIANAKFTVLTSRYEGFPMSILESLALGIPVVSVDCQSGPSEIIQSEFNGLLVENNNVKTFSSALKRMIDDEDLYSKCKKNASQSVENLSLHTVSKQWKTLIAQMQ